MALPHLADNRPKESFIAALKAPCVSEYVQEVCTEVVISQARKGESILVFLPGYHGITKYGEYLENEIKGRGLAKHFRKFILKSHLKIKEMSLWTRRTT